MKSMNMGNGQTAPLSGLGARLARTGALGVVAVVAGFLMCGCGASAEEDTKVRIATKVQKPAASTPSRSVTKPATSQAQTTMAQSAIAKSHAVASAPELDKTRDSGAPGNSLPPDIHVTVSDSAAAPGALIYLSVRATDDVSQVVLRDGVGDSQGLAFDQDSQLWRLTYRIPLNAPWERVGLSITAKNDSDRWCRVWKFVRVREEPKNDQIKLTVGS